MPVSEKFKTLLTRAMPESGWVYLVIERKIAEKFPTDGKSRRVVCRINDGEPFQCAILPWGEIFYIIVNKKRRDAMGVDAGDMVDVELAEDDSKYGLPMPEEFREVLDQDPEGDKLFHSLTAGKQRSLLYLLGNVKDIDRRIHQALIIVDHIKEHGKVVDKVLYEELKRPVAELNW
jgi:hypothetical protein